MKKFSARRVTGTRTWRAPILLSVLAGLLPLSTFAQDASATQTNPPATPNQSDEDNSTLKMEKFTVTGSYIPSAAEALALPITSLGEQDMTVAGEHSDTLNLLRKIAPSISGFGAENGTIRTADTYGGAQIANHGMSTLVLIDGRRAATSSAEAVGGFQFVDVNMIPASAIERIEVLQDGSSSTYGSDAVGGVINLILKKNYNGWEAGTHYGVATDTGHYTEREGYITGGVSNEKTSILISAEYSKHDPIMFSQRKYTNPYYATEYYPGIIDVYNIATGNDEDYQLNPKLNAPPGGGTYTIDQLVQQGVYTDLGSDSDPATVSKIQSGFNLAEHQTLIQSSKRSSFLVNASHRIYGDHLEFFGNLLYTQTNTQTSLNAQPLYPYVSTPYIDLVEAGTTPPPPGTQYIAYTTPGNPFSQAWMEQGATKDEEGNPLAGYGVDAHNRFIDYPRIFKNEDTLIRGVAGFRGQINDRYSWEGAYTYSRYKIDYSNDNLIDQNAFFAALAAGTINPFAVKQDPAALATVLGTGTMTGTSTLGMGDFVFTGKPFDLPAGPFSFAVGTQYMRETLSASADANTTNRGWIDSPSILPIDKSRSVTAIFGEIEIPIFSPSQNVTGLYGLNADLAYRIDRYSAVGVARVPKIAIKYTPINDDFSLRFSAGKSFIAPTLYYLYGPVNIGSTAGIDYTPYGSNVQQSNVQFEGQSGSNPDLKPATANNWTLGFVFTPHQVKGLSVTVDFFDSFEKGLISSPLDQTVVQSVEDLGSASPYVNFLHFGTADGPTATAPGQVSSHPKSAVWVVTPLENLAGQLVRGFDGAVEYVLPTTSAGRWDFKTNFTVYNTFRTQWEPSEPYYNYVGTATSLDAYATTPRWRTYSTIDWRWKGFDIAVNHTFIPSVKDLGPGGAEASDPVHVASYQQFDLYVGYDFKGKKWAPYLNGLTVDVGVDNIFNRNPPVALNAFTDTNADVGTYGALGRLLYVDASIKF
ncbi:MAG TPA: TonB-dependent receptor [Opitutaceae bacterium]